MQVWLTSKTPSYGGIIQHPLCVSLLRLRLFCINRLMQFVPTVRNVIHIKVPNPFRFVLVHMVIVELFRIKVCRNSDHDSSFASAFTLFESLSNTIIFLDCFAICTTWFVGIELPYSSFFWTLPSRSYIGS